MIKATAFTVLATTLLAGCSSADSDLEDFINRTKQEQPGGVEPLRAHHGHGLDEDHDVHGTTSGWVGVERWQGVPPTLARP